MLYRGELRILRAWSSGAGIARDRLLHGHTDCVGNCGRPTFLPLPQQLSGVSILINDSSVAPILAVAELGRATGETIAVLGTGFGATYPPKPVAFPAPASPAFSGTLDFLVPATEYNLSQPLRVLNVGPRAAKISRR